MEKERENKVKDPFEQDDLDDAVAAADDTGMIAGRRDTVMEEIEEAQEPDRP